MVDGARADYGPFLLGGAELITFKIRGPEYTVFENVTRAGYAGPPPSASSPEI